LDDEILHLLAGWAAVFVGGSLAAFSAVFGSVFVGLLWSLLLAAGILVLVYAFLRWRLPEIIEFVKKREWEEWTRSQGLL
jgi:Kef-type K+ transport system membrane component KefB